MADQHDDVEWDAHLGPPWPCAIRSIDPSVILLEPPWRIADVLLSVLAPMIPTSTSRRLTDHTSFQVSLRNRPGPQTLLLEGFVFSIKINLVLLASANCLFL